MNLLTFLEYVQITQVDPYTAYTILMRKAQVFPGISYGDLEYKACHDREMTSIVDAEKAKELVTKGLHSEIKKRGYAYDEYYPKYDSSNFKLSIKEIKKELASNLRNTYINYFIYTLLTRPEYKNVKFPIQLADLTNENIREILETYDDSNSQIVYALMYIRFLIKNHAGVHEVVSMEKVKKGKIEISNVKARNTIINPDGSLKKRLAVSAVERDSEKEKSLRVPFVKDMTNTSAPNMPEKEPSLKVGQILTFQDYINRINKERRGLSRNARKLKANAV